MQTLTLSRQGLPRAILELARAECLQRHLLACTQSALGAARSRGCDVALHFQPDDWVGGDYVDVVPLPCGRVFFALADVCGKGMSSAMIAAGLWSSVRCLLADGADLAGLMDRLNAHLFATLPSGFVTMFAATLYPATGEMWYVNAAHHPAWLLAPDSSRRLVGEDADVPLGIDTEEFREQYAKLAPGDLLALYTDGCIDRAGSDGRPLDSADLAHMIADVRGNAEAPLQAVADRLADRLIEMEALARGHGVNHDDSTLLLLRLRGGARAVTPHAMRLDEP